MRQSLRLLRASVPSTIAMEQRIAAIAAVSPFAGDPRQLHQVITNLVTNAAQAIGPRTGTITIEVAGEAGSGAGDAVIRLSVADAGCGMDDVTTRRIFEPFFTTKAVGEGTGLGLSVVHGIIASHGGRVAVESVLGQGTRFDVYLPPAAPSRSARSSRRAAAT
jgi:signal transduction histidine kinase